MTPLTNWENDNITSNEKMNRHLERFPTWWNNVRIFSWYPKIYDISNYYRQLYFEDEHSTNFRCLFLHWKEYNDLKTNEPSELNGKIGGKLGSPLVNYTFKAISSVQMNYSVMMTPWSSYGSLKALNLLNKHQIQKKGTTWKIFSKKIGDTDRWLTSDASLRIGLIWSATDISEEELN